MYVVVCAPIEFDSRYWLAIVTVAAAFPRLSVLFIRHGLLRGYPEALSRLAADRGMSHARRLTGWRHARREGWQSRRCLPPSMRGAGVGAYELVDARRRPGPQASVCAVDVL
jgi:hypothetical protein